MRYDVGYDEAAGRFAWLGERKPQQQARAAISAINTSCRPPARQTGCYPSWSDVAWGWRRCSRTIRACGYSGATTRRDTSCWLWSTVGQNARADVSWSGGREGRRPHRRRSRLRVAEPISRGPLGHASRPAAPDRNTALVGESHTIASVGGIIRRIAGKTSDYGKTNARIAWRLSRRPCGNSAVGVARPWLDFPLIPSR